MTTDSHLFRTEPGRLPLYEGKMIHQFTHQWAKPRYWVDEREGRKTLLGRTPDTGQSLDYQSYRLAFRDVARNTDERTMIMTILPPNVFCPHTMSLERVFPDGGDEPTLSADTRLFLCSLFDSFPVDFLIRQRVTAHVSFFFVYNLPIPRLTPSDSRFGMIVNRAARLICTTSEFDDLAREIGLGSHRNGATDPAERARLCAELDALVAHLYGLTEEEFAYILTTFPLVSDETKQATLIAYRRNEYD